MGETTPPLCQVDHDSEDRIEKETIELDADTRYVPLINPREVDRADLFVATLEVE